MTMLIPPTYQDCKLVSMKDTEKFKKLCQPVQNERLDRVRLLAFLPNPYVLPPEVEEAQKQFSKIIEEDTVIFKNTNLSPQVETILNALIKIGKVFEFTSKPENRRAMIIYNQILSHPNTQIATRMHQRAIGNILTGKAVPFYAVAFDALKQPEPKTETDKLLEEILRTAMAKKGTMPDKLLVQELAEMIKNHSPQNGSNKNDLSISERRVKRAQKYEDTKTRIRRERELRAQKLEIQKTLARHDAKIKELLAPPPPSLPKKILIKTADAVKYGFSKTASGISMLSSRYISPIVRKITEKMPKNGSINVTTLHKLHI